MKMRMRFVSAGVVSALIGCVGSAHAGVMLAGTTDTPLFGAGQDANTTALGNVSALVQEFTLAEASTIKSVDLYGFSMGSPIDVFLLDALGPGAMETDILASTLAAPVDSDAVFASFHNVVLPDTSVDAGTFYLVITSSDVTGFKWRQVNPSGGTGVGVGATATFPVAQQFFNQTFTPLVSSTLNAFGFSINGVTGGPSVPSPGSIALFGVSGVLLAGRRRR